MKLLTSWTLKWWEIGLLKISLMAFGAILGAYFSDIVYGWLNLLWVAFLLPAGYLLYRYYRANQALEPTS